MDWSCESILNIWKDLRKWCHENFHLFVQGNGIEDEPSIGCRENINTMHYNPHFNFEEKFMNIPIMALSSDLFNVFAGQEIHIPITQDSRYFLPRKSSIYIHQSISYFLSTYIRHQSFAMKFIVSLNKHVPLPW